MRPLASVCSARCALKKVRQAKQEERQETKRRKAELKTIPELKREAQTVFNQWIRLRDKGSPCISCGKPDNQNGYQMGRDAGHYRSVGSAPHLRFEENNVHAQCVHCNQYLSGNVIGYRLGLIERIGIEEVERLESDNRVHKWTREELIEIRARYVAKLKELRSKS